MFAESSAAQWTWSKGIDRWLDTQNRCFQWRMSATHFFWSSCSPPTFSESCFLGVSCCQSLSLQFDATVRLSEPGPKGWYTAVHPYLLSSGVCLQLSGWWFQSVFNGQFPHFYLTLHVGMPHGCVWICCQPCKLLCGDSTAQRGHSPKGHMMVRHLIQFSCSACQLSHEVISMFNVFLESCFHGSSCKSCLVRRVPTLEVLYNGTAVTEAPGAENKGSLQRYCCAVRDMNLRANKKPVIFFSESMTVDAIVWISVYGPKCLNWSTFGWGTFC